MLAAGQAVSALAIYIYIPIFPLIADDRGVSESIIGYIFASGGLPAIFMAISMAKYL